MLYNLIFVLLLFMPFFIYLYLKMLELIYGKENITKKDPLNKKIFTISLFNIIIPICGWRLLYIITFYIITLFVNKIINNKIIRTIIVFLIGITWFFGENLIYDESSKNIKTYENIEKYNIVYKNIYKPRKDDIYLNIIGQIIYIIMNDI